MKNGVDVESELSEKFQGKLRDNFERYMKAGENKKIRIVRDLGMMIDEEMNKLKKEGVKE